LITSSADVKPLSAGADAQLTDIDGLRLTIKASEHEKCERCWHHNETVGQSAANPTLCSRCETNIEGDGEVRHYA